MDVSENFVLISSLICEPARAKMLWSLLDGKAYTASELAAAADISATSASNHLSRLLEAEIVKVENQGRHRYYSFANTGVAYAVEAMAQLAKVNSKGKFSEKDTAVGIKYCRTCYDHLAGYVGVTIAETMEQKGFMVKDENSYLVTVSGWDWLQQFRIYKQHYTNNRRPLTRQCLDWSERRPHLAGQLGADLLKAMLEKKWFKKIQFSRELLVTAKGRQGMYEFLGVVLK
jgi:DNA-binding transcriptional ArsR family regulator